MEMLPALSFRFWEEEPTTAPPAASSSNTQKQLAAEGREERSAATPTPTQLMYCRATQQQHTIIIIHFLIADAPQGGETSCAVSLPFTLHTNSRLLAKLSST